LVPAAADAKLEGNGEGMFDVEQWIQSTTQKHQAARMDLSGDIFARTQIQVERERLRRLKIWWICVVASTRWREAGRGTRDESGEMNQGEGRN
jgi:hypothetical protein